MFLVCTAGHSEVQEVHKTMQPVPVKNKKHLDREIENKPKKKTLDVNMLTTAAAAVYCCRERYSPYMTFGRSNVQWCYMVFSWGTCVTITVKQ